MVCVAQVRIDVINAYTTPCTYQTLGLTNHQHPLGCNGLPALSSNVHHPQWFLQVQPFPHIATKTPARLTIPSFLNPANKVFSSMF